MTVDPAIEAARELSRAIRRDDPDVEVDVYIALGAQDEHPGVALVLRPAAADGPVRPPHAYRGGISPAAEHGARRLIDRLTPREREVLELLAQGRSNNGIAGALTLSASAVAKHINAIFTKLDISPAQRDNRRVLAALLYLGHQSAG